MGSVRPGRTFDVEVLTLDGPNRATKSDTVVTEEPLELRLLSALRPSTSSGALAVTMRTPGNDFELAAGFVYNEGIVPDFAEIASIDYCLDPQLEPDQRYNVVNVTVRGELPDLQRFERHFTTSSACGVCGRAQLESLRERVAPIDDDVRIGAGLLYALPDRMRAAQRVFESTGGLHAAALFDERGEAIAVREDVGRHNAVDKLVGWGLMNGRVPFARSILMVSGRASYEILQKAAVARIPIVCSVSAPSSLAVDLARELGITLAGFLRGTRANVYAHEHRIG